MRLYNTLTRKIEDFKPLEDKEVKLYTCGPTVYDSAHIGNLRAYIFNDSLKRALLTEGYKIRHTMNITNVDDKTIRKAAGDKTSFEKLVKDYEAKFWADFSEINNLKPDTVTRPTEYIEKIVKFIDQLIQKGVAYKANDGSIYFSIAKFADYGKLSHLDKEGLKAGARVSQDEYDKENPADFVLWKAWDEADGDIFWEPSTWLGSETVLQKGRPGWHIECSVMATDTLGETIDIHTGGVDLIFPHHENEIAQTEAVTGKCFACSWVHNEHLLVDGKKMSKSLNNFYTLDDITAKGFSGLDFRYLCLQAHYRSKMNFTWEGLEAARNARLRLARIAEEISGASGGELESEIIGQFNLKIANDLDIPGALAVLWDMVRSDQLSDKNKLATLVKMDQILGLNIEKFEKTVLTKEQQELADAREEARKSGDFLKADEIRKKLVEMGVEIEDTKEGTRYKAGK